MKKIFLPVILLSLVFAACKKESAEFQTAAIADYNPLQVGKYITYQLDSLVYVNFGTTQEIHSYEVKYLTDAEITDNMGRPAFRIIRYIRQSPTANWIPDATFMSVNTGTSLEFIENNLRYIKLKLPIREGANWKGNSFIDTYSLYSDLKYLGDWDYTYGTPDIPANLDGQVIDSTITVFQRDEITGNPGDPNAYSEENFSMEIYGKGIGMIYREFLHTTYQPGNGGYIEDGSYGVTYRMIDHN